MNYVKILRAVAHRNKSTFDIPVQCQKQFIWRLSEPKDLIERSYAQYRCTMVYLYCFYEIIINVISGVLAPIFAVWYYLKRNPRRLGVEQGALIDVDASEQMLRMVPSSLKTQPLYSVKWDKGVLRSDDLRLLWQMVCHYPFAPYFIFKSMVKMARYRYEVERYQPRAVVVHNEYAFTSSVLTAWCRRNGIQHINFMHGERIFDLQCAFFQYDRCYVWHSYYTALYCDMRAEKTQFQEEIPESLIIALDKWKDVAYYADFKYILCAFTETELQCIVQAMQKFKQKGYSVKFRLHPRHSDVRLARKYIAESDIEYPRQVPIEKSVANAGCVIGCYSTVLLQAYLSKVSVAIDDITYADFLQKLEERQYILMHNTEIGRLSTML